MTFDIISITAEEIEQLPTVKQKLVRTAQQKKDELLHKLEAEKEEVKTLFYSNRAEGSTAADSYIAQLTAECDREVEILRDNLIFNLSVMDAPTSDETGGDNGGDQPDVGYVVDYGLSYLERYVLVRDYYMTIADPNERLNLYIADEVAFKYLDSYYNYLFNYLITFTYE